MAKLAPSLVNLRSEVNRRWPKRDKRSDGWLGDRRHRRRRSDHNPDSRGIVNAVDIDASSIDAALVIRAAIAHPSTNYIIFKGKIYSRNRGFRPRRYRGSNPHNGHIHVSIVRSRAAQGNKRGWLKAVPPKKAPPKRITVPARKGTPVALANLRYGKNNADVADLQRALRRYLAARKVNVDRLNPSGVTGRYGNQTIKMVVKANQLIAKSTGNKWWLTLSGNAVGKSLALRLGLRPL